MSFGVDRVQDLRIWSLALGFLLSRTLNPTLNSQRFEPGPSRYDLMKHS